MDKATAVRLLQVAEARAMEASERTARQRKVVEGSREQIRQAALNDALMNYLVTFLYLGLVPEGLPLHERE
jgi:hypothetical protein